MVVVSPMISFTSYLKASLPRHEPSHLFNQLHHEIMPPTTRAVAQKLATTVAGNESDYGSDIDDDTITDLLVQAESQPLHAVAVESIEEHNPLPSAVRLPKQYRDSPRTRRTKVLVDEDGITFEVPDNDGPLGEPSVEVEYDESNRLAFSRRFDPFLE